ncbi:MAG: PfkB family carbohydrate kinase [Planctomycetia bacterium]|nr:PfkB family carbohydrate kinase [Planctomycetia bacterium]
MAKKVVAAGLTPAWQRLLEFSRLELGRVNRAHSSQSFAAGKSVNVALAVYSLGGDVRAILPLGGANGENLRRDLEKIRLPFRDLETRAETRVCTTLVDHESGCVTELVEEAVPLSDSEWEKWDALCAEEFASGGVVVISGSLPQGVPSKKYAEMCELASRSGAQMVLDFRGEGLLECLKFRPLVVKPNRKELEATVGFALHDEARLIEAARQLNVLGARWVIVSDGPGTLLVVSSEETRRFVPREAVPQVSQEGRTIPLCPIGCGDALTGGLALALARDETIESAVAQGMEAAFKNLYQFTTCRFFA